MRGDYRPYTEKWWDTPWDEPDPRAQLAPRPQPPPEKRDARHEALARKNIELRRLLRIAKSLLRGRKQRLEALRNGPKEVQW